MRTKTLTSRQVRAYLLLSEYNFAMIYRTSATNPADRLSRRPNYMADAKAAKHERNSTFVQPLVNLLQLGTKSGNSAQVTTITTRSQSNRERNTRLKGANLSFRRQDARDAEESSSTDVSITDRSNQTPEPVSDLSSTESDKETRSEPVCAKLDQTGLVRPFTDEAKAKAINECHDDPLAGHFGARRTLERVQRKYFWTGMQKDVADYVHDCLRCQRANSKTHKPYGLLRPLPVPDGPWQHVTMDFITDLPPSKLNGVVYDVILVIVDRFSKMSHYVPARMDWDGTDLAQAWIREVIRLHGNPDSVLSDRGPLMSAKHWDTFHHYLNSRRVLTSAFHPQTNGQTERQNKTLEQYLRIFCCLEQDDWSLWISLAEMAYNDSRYLVTRATPFQVYYGYYPKKPTWPSQPLGEGESP